MALRKGLEQRAREDRKGGEIDKEMLKALRRGGCFGSEEFRAALLDRLDGGAGRGSAASNDSRHGRDAVGGVKPMNIKPPLLDIIPTVP